MAYDFVTASSQYISGGAPVTGPAFTWCAWAKTTSASGNQTILSIGAGAGAAYHALFYDMSGPTLKTQSRNEAATIAFSVATGAAQNATKHAAGVHSSSASRTAYLDGVAATADTTDVSPESITVIGIGVINRGTPAAYIAGTISEVAIWSVALTAAEIGSLAKGFSPRRIRPQSLKFYAPLVRNLQDLRAGLALTNNNTATVSAHPRVY